MKKIILAAVAVMGMAAMGASTANAGVRFSFGIPAPVVRVRAPVVVVAPPVVCAPAPQVVYAPPAPVVCAPPVVYSAPAYCAPVPRVYCPPAPVVRFGFDFGHYRPAYRHGRW
jgi:hypothetical protein